MALNRTALRLAAIEALAPHALLASAGPWPTIAEHRVVDTLLERLFEGIDGERRPLIVVYVDGADRMARGGEGDDLAGDSRDLAVLAIEIALPISGQDDDGNPYLIAPQSDAQAEALLDLLEAQVHDAILRGRMDGPLRHVLIAITKVDSEVQRDPDLNVKVAARRIEYHCLIRQQEEPLPIGALGIAALPAPLRQVAQDLDPASAGFETCELLATAIGEPQAFADLQSIRMAAAFTRETGSAPAAPIVAGTGGDKQASVTFP